MFVKSLQHWACTSTGPKPYKKISQIEFLNTQTLSKILTVSMYLRNDSKATVNQWLRHLRTKDRLASGYGSKAF